MKVEEGEREKRVDCDMVSSVCVCESSGCLPVPVLSEQMRGARSPDVRLPPVDRRTPGGCICECGVLRPPPALSSPQSSVTAVPGKRLRFANWAAQRLVAVGATASDVGLPYCPFHCS